MSSSSQVGHPPESDAGSLAADTAALFAAVYQIQDELEPKNGMAEKRSTESAARAYDRMGTIYTREFPDVPADDARQAGRAHVDALFKQDIIENDPRHETAADVLADERWRGDDTPWCVEGSLREVCECVGMDEVFAEALTEFYRLHGQQRDGWKEAAYRAHRTKATRITGSETTGEQLAPYFVISVLHHNARTWAEGQAVIREHYERLFELNGAAE